LITQFDITTSTDAAGRGICSITPFKKCTFGTAAARAFCWERMSFTRRSAGGTWN
jgi:hypothetical protein